MQLPCTPPKSISFYDSGVGGLSILSAFIKHVPSHYIYIADIAHFPYGNKPRQQLTILAQKQLHAFCKNSETIFLACHTVSTLRSQLTLPIKPCQLVDMVQLTYNVLDECISAHKRIGMIATTSTYQSGIYQEYMSKKHPQNLFFMQACPYLAEAIENNHYTQTQQLLIRYVTPLLKKNITVLVLGCTHYELIKPLIKQVIFKYVKIISLQEYVSRLIPASWIQAHVARPSIQLITTGTTLEKHIFEKKFFYFMKQLEMNDAQ